VALRDERGEAGSLVSSPNHVHLRKRSEDDDAQLG
jgi:hypothetical protein